MLPTCRRCGCDIRRGLLLVMVTSIVLGLSTAGLLSYLPPEPPIPGWAGISQNVVMAQEVPAELSEGIDFSRTVLPFLKTYCLSCHGADQPESGLSLEKYRDEIDVLKDRRTWSRVLEVISSSQMPPREHAQPTADERETIVKFLDQTLNQIDCARVANPGRVTIRRLNRAEYNNTIRDLMGVSFQPAEDFPSDDVGYGFDHIGDVLSLPPLLMEKYLAAAEAIVRESLLDGFSAEYAQHDFDQESVHRSRAAHPHGDDALILVSNGDVHVEYTSLRSGQYQLKVSAAETPAGTEATQMEFLIDDQPAAEFTVEQTERAFGQFECEVHLTRGPHRFAVAFLNDFYDPKAADKNRRDRNLIVRDIQIVGPVAIDEAEYPAFQKSFLLALPGEHRSFKEAARENLRPFLRRAFRRPPTSEEVSRFVQLAESIAANGESFVSAMQVAVTAVLVSPQFLFRMELDPVSGDSAGERVLNDFELATRLSYFLWSSLPDEELLSLAEQAELQRGETMERQIRRMLADRRSAALVENFCEQWLQLRILNEVTPDPSRFPEFDPQLREDMKQETRLFFASIMQEDRSILDLLDGKYTFLNERLGKHYGLEHSFENEWARISLDGTQRGGILTQASILTLTSNPDRTSPVKRGKWVMEVLLNQPPPPPPPNVPELSEISKAKPELTLRQQLELHRENPACATCHRVMDQLGFGLENFDAIGRWRDQVDQQPVDARGQPPGGGEFQGPGELAAVLRGKQAAFVEGMTEKMLTFALGRGLEFYDRCAIVKIVDALAGQDHRFSALISEIVKSDPFRLRREEAVTAH